MPSAPQSAPCSSLTSASVGDPCLRLSQSLRPELVLGDCFADGGHDFVCPEVQCGVADDVAGSDQVDQRGGAAFNHRESQFLYPLRHSAPDPAALVVAGGWQRVTRKAAGYVVDGFHLSRVSPGRSSSFVDDGPWLGNQGAAPVSEV